MSAQKHACSFCWLFLDLYPKLKEVPDMDAKTFRLHLRQKHGLTEEISV